MRPRTITIFIAVVLFGIFSWWRWELISASFLSFGGFIFFSLGSLSPAWEFWSPSLAEYWLALGGWIAAGYLLVKWAVRAGHGQATRARAGLHVLSSHLSMSLALLLIMVFVGICSPFLLPVDPTAQGDLTTTRLLPPLSRGSLYVEQRHLPSDQTGEDSLTRTVRNAMMRLTGRTYLLRGPDGNQAKAAINEADSSGTFCFLFGTDDVGRDVFSRALAGTRVSLLVGGFAAAGAVLIGAFIGFIAGMSRRGFDSLLMRITDLFLAVPSIILVISLVAFVGHSVASLVAVLSLTGWMSTARIVRSEVHVLREKEFVAAAKLLGAAPYRIIIGHLLPNVWPILATSAVLQFGSAVLGEAALSFLGLGIQAPTASWGNMIGDSISYVSIGWWVGLFPGILLSGAVLATHALVEE